MLTTVRQCISFEMRLHFTDAIFQVPHFTTQFYDVGVLWCFFLISTIKNQTKKKDTPDYWQTDKLFRISLKLDQKSLIDVWMAFPLKSGTSDHIHLMQKFNEWRLKCGAGREMSGLEIWWNVNIWARCLPAYLCQMWRWSSKREMWHDFIAGNKRSPISVQCFNHQLFRGFAASKFARIMCVCHLIFNERAMFWVFCCFFFFFFQPPKKKFLCSQQFFGD